ncbi:peptidase, U32 family [Synechococcus sp. PCC 7335]|uniref:U32 family peptidase n=1 Tax=Synechococcus sp. (strain ATCC 29403 / PCC 7335) TaxID=91464 RepID=UPI00017EDFD2|nr:U32 family peptidase [Synechococcus sp. PCC 7335]EDX84395.1 peptidase, U32 family [Synechococcus sp. PCC 7335]
MSVSSHLLSKDSEPIFDLQKTELLAPAGDWDCVKAAVENGADAIYFGLDRFNARMRAHNFTIADLPELMTFLHRRGVRGYVTLNTLIFPAELKAAAHYLRTIIKSGVDAAIVQDVGICRLIRHLSSDFPIHASTQMTITSAAGVKFAQQIGAELVVLARECSIKEINRIQRQLKKENIAMPLETFVHGALCVAYSGQCLTSESLGGRSANRGECAQACRMTYDLLADGKEVDLGDRAYLLSPQDLSGLPVVPDLIRSGIASLKIEGRLKTPEYVANVTRVYRQVLDRVFDQTVERLEQDHDHSDHQLDLKFKRLEASYYPSGDERYSLEMAFSRGLSTGWFQGIDNQRLVHARFGKKRGALVGQVEKIVKTKREHRIVVKLLIAVKPGDGVVIDSSQPDDEQGGRLYGVETKGEETFLSFGRKSLDFTRIQVGDRIWKTSDPELDRAVRQTYSGNQPRFKRPISIEVFGKAGGLLKAIAHDYSGHTAQATTEVALVSAHSKPLTTERLIQQLSRLGTTPFNLKDLQNNLEGQVMVPVSALNQLRRELVTQLIEQKQQLKSWTLNPHASYRDLLPVLPVNQPAHLKQQLSEQSPVEQKLAVQLIPLVRNLSQLQAAITTNAPTIYCEFENPIHYQEAVALIRRSTAELFIAPPRITKPSERYILDQVRKAKADGYLIRNYDQLDYFSGDRAIGDFSLNVANPITASYFKGEFNLERLSASYDLNVQQLENLLETAPAEWFEITLHQHMPMFHMAHCVFCAFLSEGTDFTNCGRPCEKHKVKLRDRTGAEHILSADAGCRNTLFNGKAQTGAEFAARLIEKGARYFRIEFLDETPEQVTEILSAYRKLVDGELEGVDLWRSLNLASQLGVTRGTLEKSHR